MRATPFLTRRVDRTDQFQGAHSQTIVGLPPRRESVSPISEPKAQRSTAKTRRTIAGRGGRVYVIGPVTKKEVRD